MKKLLLIAALLMLTGCADMYAEKTSVEVYRPDGTLLGKAVSNKGYTDFKCEVDIDGDKQHLLWTAKKVNSDTVANTVAEANSKLAGTINNLVGSAAGAVIGVPLK